MSDPQTIAETAPSQPQKQSSFGGFLLFLKMSQALCLALFIFFAIASYLIPDQYNRLVIYNAGLLAGFIFLFILHGQFANFAKTVRGDLKNKAKLYANMLPKKDASVDSTDELIESRERALEYSQELIDDYKKIRRTTRNLYYVLQLATIILSGVTPILVVVDQQSSANMPAYVRWLPVIFPAIAAIVSSFSTSFPLETRWNDANRIVEQLEAEQEKFILGVTKPYRAFMIVKDDEERRKKLKLTIENFIIEVNKIHLQQFGSVDEKVSTQEAEATLQSTT
ncbi:MAG: DUF4231 domain-containing protein [Xenococcus sp. (in: cyanobacteria)]